MSVSASTIRALFLAELAAVTDRRVLAHIHSLAIQPECQLRRWDYGAPGQTYPCWLVLAHTPSNTGIAYCEFGFGPSMPWGLLFLEGTDHMSMGMDSGWFKHFLEAYFESKASAELPIWRVFQNRANAYPGEPITDENTWESTWAEVMRLRSADPRGSYNCWQSVYASDA